MPLNASQGRETYEDGGKEGNGGLCLIHTGDGVRGGQRAVYASSVEFPTVDSHSGHLVPTQWPPRWYIFCKKPTQNPTFFPPSINPSTRSSINTSIHEVLGHLTGLVALQYHH
jgi:hypothetical protein